MLWATGNPSGIGMLRATSPDPSRHRLSLVDVRKGLCLVVEPDNIHDFATPNGQHLKPKGCSTTLPGILCTSHTHADEKSIAEDLHFIHAPPDASISTPLIPGQHLVAGLAAWTASARRSPGHGRVKQFGKGRQVLRCQRISDKHRNLVHTLCHRTNRATSSAVEPPVTWGGAKPSGRPRPVLWDMPSDDCRAESENVPVWIYVSTLVPVPIRVLRHVDRRSRCSPLIGKRVGIVNKEVDRVSSARRGELFRNSEVDFDAVTLREPVARVQILPSRKSEPLVVIKRSVEVANGKDRSYSPYSCHRSKR